MALLPDALRLGPAQLVVGDLARATAWYERVIGLAVLERRGDGTVVLGADAPVLVLREDPDARPPHREAGLYHVALLFGTREELAMVARRIAEDGTPVTGASDHETHEAIYLPDADGNGLELACDRPREQWPAHLGYAGGPQPLDVPDLMATIDGQPTRAAAEPGLRVGHLHLHVASLERSRDFWSQVVGFDVMAEIPRAAGFVAAGGYHHHLGFNVWRGEGIPPAPADGVLGLDHWTVDLPAADAAALDVRLAAAEVGTTEHAEGFLLHDPDGIALLVRST